jgi:4-hydroxy-2-oxoheptanedioate aldolase
MSPERGVAVNTVKRNLASSGYAFGTWVLSVRSPAIVAMAAAAGFDFVVIDLQHSDFSIETVADMCGIARASGLVPIVRMPDGHAAHGNRLQDVGAMGLMFPEITTRAEVDHVRSWMLYPPDGHRGHTSLSAPFDYAEGDADELKRAVNGEMLVVVQVENRQGAEQIESIVGAGGVDVVEVGAGDLATDLGVSGRVRDPLVIDIVDHIIDVCGRYGTTVGMTCSSEQDAADLVRRGVRFLAYSNDRHILVRSYRDGAAMLRRVSGVSSIE